MTLVLDTNVLVAAFTAHGVCNELVEHCFVRHEVALSAFILDEVQDVLTRKFDFSASEARAVTRLLQARARLVVPAPLSTPVCRDRDDDAILAAARTAGAVVIITGDRDLLDLKAYEGIPILTPAAFWAFEMLKG